MSALLEIKGLSKSFGPISAVDDVSFSVQRGEVLGFLGPNGAGKSTTMKMAAGFLPPSRGTAAIAGFDILAQPIEAKSRLGYLPEGAPAYGDMSPFHLFRFVGKIRGLQRRERRRRIDHVVERLELQSVLHRPIETLSKGFKRRVGLAQAILHDPDLLILDEPTDGLDPNQKHQVRQLLSELAVDKAIVISTHILEEVEAVCSRAIIIARGRIVADSEPGALQARSRYHNAVGLRIRPELRDRTLAALRAIDAIADVESRDSGDGAEIIAFPKAGAPILGSVRERIAQDGIEARELFVERGRLDEVFRQLTAA